MIIEKGTMRVILSILLTILGYISFSQSPNSQSVNNLNYSDTCYWSGKKIDCKSLDDSMKVHFRNFCDSVEKSKSNRKISPNKK